MAHALRTPDYEGGFITKEVENGWIYAYDDKRDLLNVKPVNYVHKGIECKYGKVIDCSDNIVVLQKGKETSSLKKDVLNLFLQKSLDNTSPKPYEEKISGTFDTFAGKVNVISATAEVRQLLTIPDRIKIKKGSLIFEKSIKDKKYIGKVEKGILKSISEEDKKKKLLFKGVATTLEPAKLASGSNGWNQRGGMKPGHKYLQRKEAGTKENGSPKYIYLYQLPNGEKQWKDDEGKPVSSQESAQKDYTPDFKAGETIKQGNRVGKVIEASENYLAVNFDGQKEVINKKEHLRKIKEQGLYKEGDEITYEDQPAKVLKVTGNLALVKTQNDNRLKVVSIEKQFEKVKKNDSKNNDTSIQEESPADNDYETTPDYQKFAQTAEDDGFGKVNDLTVRKFVKVGKILHSVEWRYNPSLKEVEFYVDGQRDRALEFMGEQFKVRDINDKGWSLENKAGETGLFLSHKDYEKAIDGKDDNPYDSERENLGELVGEVIHTPKKTFHFGGKLSPEALERVEAEKAKTKPGRAILRTKKSEPLQTEAQKAAIEAERANKQEQIKEALSSNQYADFSKAMKERGFEINENKFTGSKKVDIGGKKFEINARYKPDDGVWETSVDGPNKEFKLGDNKYPITDITDNNIYYQDGADEKEISVKDAESINGKSIFEPTKASKGIISSLPPQKVYFGLNDKDSAAVYYEVVDADDLTASHLAGGEANKNYSISDAQNRDRNTPQSLAQINKIATNPNFDFLSDSKTATDGAPVVNQDYNVIAGNGRSIGVKLHYENGGEKYKQDLWKNAEKLGFTKEDIGKIKNPVLVRRMNIDNKEAQRLGAMSNTSNMLATEAREEAKGKATRIDDKTFNNLAQIFDKAKGEKNSISEYLDEVGPEIVKELIDKHIIPENEQHLYFNTSTGKLDASHKDKLKELLTQSVLGDSSKEFERIPDAAREGISKSLGDVFSLKGKSGDLVPHLQNAVKILARYNAVKDKFSNPDEFIAQDANNVFDKLTGSKEDLALFELLTSGKPNEIKNKIREYKVKMESDIFGDGLSPEEAFNQTFKPKYKEGINKSLISRLIIFGQKFLQKSIDTTKNMLIPSKKNPNVDRWQNIVDDMRNKKQNLGAEEKHAQTIAADFAKEKHKNQKYNGGDYFDEHLEKVKEEAEIIADKMGLDKELIEKVAYLHDVLEDTPTTYGELKETFGEDAADNVLLLSDKIKSENDRRIPEEEYFQKIGQSKIASAVKAADRIVNINSLKKIEDKERRIELYNKYANELKYFEANEIYPELIKKELANAI